MKKLIIALAALMVTAAAYGQGLVSFQNRQTGVVDARVLLPDGTGAGVGFTAQLMGGAAGTAVDKLVALTPTTTFRSTSAAAQGYVNPLDVTVPGVAAGAQATLIMRAFNGASYDSSLIRGQSGPITVGLGGIPAGGGPPLTSPVLAGMGSFTLQIIPEPSTIALGVLGAAVLLFRRRK